jgi:hypothetical protein
MVFRTETSHAPEKAIAQTKNALVNPTPPQIFISRARKGNAQFSSFVQPQMPWTFS